MTPIDFSTMELTAELNKAIEAMGFTTPTPVQAQAILPMLVGRDVLAKSQTGTGKTMAFAIPAIERVDAEINAVQVLVLCPTRELAMQAADEFRKLAKFMPHINPVEIYGGASLDRQCIQLRRANIVIGTPGRIMDHLRRRTLKLHELRMLILDEADEMLDMGFKDDIETILQDVPETRQTAMFSATMPPAILKLTREYQHDPVVIEIDKDEATIKGIHQTYVEVPQKQKAAALTMLLEYHRPTRTIIFCNTKRMVDEIVEKLAERGFAAVGLHSDVRQSQRTTIMYDFKHSKTTILAATDIAARGIDVSDVDFVINYDVPQNSEYYIHRIGRTGRAGKTGCSITICGTRGEAMFIRRIAAQTRSELTRVELPTAEAIEDARGAELVAHIEDAMNLPVPAIFGAAMDALAAKGYTAERIAKAVLTRFCTSQYAVLPDMPEIKRDTRRESASRDGMPRAGSPREGASRRMDDAMRYDALRCDAKRNRAYSIITLDIGSDRGVWKNHILGALTERTGLVGDDIGKIEVFPERSKVEVPTESLEETLVALQGCTVCGKRVHAERLTEANARRPRERDDRKPRRDERKPQRKQEQKPYRKHTYR